MIYQLLKNRVIVSIILISFIILGTLFIYIPKVTEQNIINTVIRNSKNTVEQIKLNRAYYLESVVKDIKKHAPNIKFDYNHMGADGKLPFPTTTIHDLSKIYSDNTGLTFHFYSKYPFSPKQDRVLSDTQTEALNFIKENESGMWVKRDTLNGKEVLRVAVADYMTDQTCVDCHNSHKDRTWPENFWKLGDKRGVLEVITPLEEDLYANNVMRNKILIFIGALLLLLVIYYSIIHIKRENELLSANDILDKRVKDEVEKNLRREKQLISQSRTAAMGEMMAAIIHQWKQPLNSISIANSAIDMHIVMDDFDKELFSRQVGNISTQIKYMNDTMNDFRNFFKNQPRVCFELSKSIKEVHKLVGKVYEIQKITIEKELQDNLIVDGYSNELNQVIINIFNNARDAIKENEPEVRKIFVKTFVDEEGMAVLRIKDCAGGIPEDMIGKIFDPYVTTKDEDSGTGIGLDMSKSIIEKIDGTIEAANVTTEVEGKEHKGAQFTVRLKRCENG